MYQYNQQNNYAPAKPENYLVWAILCTLLCCLPLGVVSIIKSTEVDTLYAQGRYDEAQNASDSAKKWAMWGAIAGGVYQIFVFIYIAFCFGLGILSGLSGY